MCVCNQFYLHDQFLHFCILRSHAEPPKKKRRRKEKEKRERKGNLNKGKTKETYILFTPLRPPLLQHPWLQGLPLRPVFYLPIRFIHLLLKFLGSILNTGRISINCTHRQSVEATDGGLSNSFPSLTSTTSSSDSWSHRTLLSLNFAVEEAVQLL